MRPCWLPPRSIAKLVAAEQPPTDPRLGRGTVGLRVAWKAIRHIAHVRAGGWADNPATAYANE